jgi:hypothetical protein
MIINNLHILIHTLRKGHYQSEWGRSCTFVCNSIRLGVLIKQMDRQKLYSPRPGAPFLGISVALLNEFLRTIHTPRLCRNYDDHKSWLALLIANLERFTVIPLPPWD